MRRSLDRSRWAILLAVLAMVVAACTGGTEDTTTTTAAPDDGDTTTTTAAPEDDETTTTAAPEEASAISVGMGNLPPSAVPWTGAGSPGQYVWSQVFDALTYIAPDGSVAPGLATEWEAVDETTWEFTLRDGVTFHNGDPFNADAVVGTFDIILSEDGRATYSANVNNYAFITAWEAVDDMTVRITTETPQVLTPNALSIAYIVPPAYFNEQGAEGFATAPVGTGPYMSVAWSDQEVQLEAWDGSWRGTPSVAEVTFLNLNDSAARIQALQSGQIDIAQSVSPDQIPQLESDGFELFSGTRGSVMSLALITNAGGPLESQQVRQALNYAVDTQTIVDELLAGLVDPGQWPVEGVNGAGQDPYPYDPELAAELLADAGYPDGFEMVASSSALSAACMSGKPAKPSFCAILTTLGDETPAAAASVEILPRPETG